MSNAALYEVSPRVPFTLQVGRDSFLCYRMEPSVGSDTPEGRLRSLLWGKLGRPAFVVIGAPKAGHPIYRVGEGLSSSWPYWPALALDPGPAIGWLSKVTVEEARAHAQLEAEFEDGDGFVQSATELPVEIGDRLVWFAAFAPAVTISSGLRTLSAVDLQEVGWSLSRIVEMSERFSTHDIDFSDTESSRVEVKKRLFSSFAGLESFVDSARGDFKPAVEAYLASRVNEKLAGQGSLPS